MGGMTETSKTNPPSKTVQGLPDGTLRTTMTHVVVGDQVLVQTQTADPQSWWVPAPAKPTKRALWCTVVQVNLSTILVEVNDVPVRDQILLNYVAHTAITIKDREAGQVAAPSVDGPTVVAEARATGGRYAVDSDARMLLATRAMAVGYTREDAAQLMDDAYWVGSAPYGDECETHPGLRRYTDGDCRACTVELLAAEREVPRVEDGSVDWQAVGEIVRSRDVAPTVTPVRVPGSEPQRRALRLLGEMETSGAQPQIHGSTKRTLIRDKWITATAWTGASAATLTDDARTWLASEHTAEVRTLVVNGVTLYGATCNCGPGHENPRMARRVPWESAGCLTPADAIAVALGHGEVSRRQHEAPSVPTLGVGDRVMVEGEGPGTVTAVDPVEACGVTVRIDADGMEVDAAHQQVRPLVDADTVAVRALMSGNTTDADGAVAALVEALPVPTGAAMGERLAAEEAALPDPERSTCVRCERDLVWVHQMWIGINGEEKCPSGDRHRSLVDAELIAREQARELTRRAETSSDAARVTADDVAGLPTPVQAAADHAASRPWSARGGKRKSSSKATKRRRVLAGAR